MLLSLRIEHLSVRLVPLVSQFYRHVSGSKIIFNRERDDFIYGLKIGNILGVLVETLFLSIVKHCE